MLALSCGTLCASSYQNSQLKQFLDHVFDINEEDTSTKQFWRRALALGNNFYLAEKLRASCRTMTESENSDQWKSLVTQVNDARKRSMSNKDRSMFL